MRGKMQTPVYSHLVIQVVIQAIFVHLVLNGLVQQLRRC